MNYLETYKSEDGTHTNNIEAKWSDIKGKIPKNIRNTKHWNEWILALICNHQNKYYILSYLVRAMAIVQYIYHDDIKDDDELEIDVRPPVIEIDPEIEIFKV